MSDSNKNSNSEAEQEFLRATTIPTSPIESLKELKRKVYITKSARFAASRRLNRLNYTALISVSLLAIFNILISTVAIVFSDAINPASIRIVGISGIGISVYLIFLDMFVALRGYEKRSFVLMQSARRINELSGAIDARAPADDITKDEVKEFTQQYRQILNDFEEEHAPVDFHYGAGGSHKGVGLFKSAYNSLKYNTYHIGVFALLMLFPILVMVVSGLFFFGQPAAKTN